MGSSLGGKQFSSGGQKDDRAVEQAVDEGTNEDGSARKKIENGNGNSYNDELN